MTFAPCPRRPFEGSMSVEPKAATREQREEVVSMTARPEVAGATRIETKGGVGDQDIDYLRRKLDKVTHALHDDRFEVDAFLSLHETHDDAHQARVQASLEFHQDVVRAETRAATIPEAVDLLEERLRRQLEQRNDRKRQGRRARAPKGRGWRHGNEPSDRKPYFNRPPEERTLVAHKTFATPEATLDEARWDRYLLDYDFYLFLDAASGSDTVLWGEDKAEQVLRLEDAPEFDVKGAIGWLDALHEPFVFFRDSTTNRGAVVYRRYDGHYGLLTPR